MPRLLTDKSLGMLLLIGIQAWVSATPKIYKELELIDPLPTMVS
tara:strand:+ start:63 stop:194 length:132 start_codon:yes stop_codon:yes gene_type:complete